MVVVLFPMDHRSATMIWCCCLQALPSDSLQVHLFAQAEERALQAVAECIELARTHPSGCPIASNLTRQVLQEASQALSSLPAALKVGSAKQEVVCTSSDVLAKAAALLPAVSKGLLRLEAIELHIGSTVTSLLKEVWVVRKVAAQAVIEDVRCALFTDPCPLLFKHMV